MDHDVSYSSFMATTMPFRSPSFSFDSRHGDEFPFPTHDSYGFPVASHLAPSQPYVSSGRNSFSAPYGFIPNETGLLPHLSYYPTGSYVDVDPNLLLHSDRPRQLSQSHPTMDAMHCLQSHGGDSEFNRAKADPFNSNSWGHLFQDTIAQPPLCANYSTAPQMAPMASAVAIPSGHSPHSSVKSETASDMLTSTLHSPGDESNMSEIHEHLDHIDHVDHMEGDGETEQQALQEESRDWACPVANCGKSYRFKGDLKYHVKRKHPERIDLPSTISKPRSAKEGKSYPCPVLSCACGFKWARDLRRHIKTKHPENEDESTTTHAPSSSKSSRQQKVRALKQKQGDSTVKKGGKRGAHAETNPNAPSFVTLSISSFYDDNSDSSMLQLAASSERN